MMMKMVFCVFRDALEEGVYYEVLEKIFTNDEDALKYIKMKSRPEEYHREGWQVDN